MAISRRRSLLFLLILTALTAAFVTGILGFLHERRGLETAAVIGSGSADRVEIVASVRKVDALGQDLTLRVVPKVYGRLAARGNERMPAVDITVDTTSNQPSALHFKAWERMSSTDLQIILPTGTISDYPRDHYEARIGFAAETADERPLPIEVSLSDTDPLFRGRLDDLPAAARITGFDLHLRRARSTVLMAWAMMGVMWLLALGAIGTAWVLIVDRRGLVFPAMSWLAVTLFALVGFRNAAPGAPPMGCLMDYAAFLWAEAIVALMLVLVTYAGIAQERPSGNA
jgi:hypothetical protein